MNSSLVWHMKPTMMMVDSMAYPLEELTFPTVTLCPKSPSPDRWGPAIKILDSMKKGCSKKK